MRAARLSLALSLALALALAAPRASAAGPRISAAEPVAPALASSSAVASPPSATELAASPGSAMLAPVDPVYDRLLGDAPATAAASATPAGGGLSAGLAGLWPLGIAAIGAGLVWFARKRVPALAGPGSDGPWIVGRTSLAANTQLVLVDVRDSAGRTRRLLVSAGGGSAALLADLGEDDDDAPAPAAAAPRAAPPPVAQPPAQPPGGRPRAVRRASDPPAPTPRTKARAMSLIDEVVSTRRSLVPESEPAPARAPAPVPVERDRDRDHSVEPAGHEVLPPRHDPWGAFQAARAAFRAPR